MSHKKSLWVIVPALLLIALVGISRTKTVDNHSCDTTGNTTCSKAHCDCADCTCGDQCSCAWCE